MFQLSSIKLNSIKNELLIITSQTNLQVTFIFYAHDPVLEFSEKDARYPLLTLTDKDSLSSSSGKTIFAPPHLV